MPRNLEYWQCQTCLRPFASDEELQKHIGAFQSRAWHLFAELQKCFAHSDPKLSEEEDCGGSDDDDADNLVNDDCDGHKKLPCPHADCDVKRPRALFSWKNLLRHYTIHVPCCETCNFCGLNIDRVRKYVTHFDNCKTRKEGQRGPEFNSKENNAMERRMILRNRAAQELRLKTPTRANTSDEDVLSQETSSRKRALEMADPDPESVHQSRKPRITKEDDTSYQAPGTEDVATEIAAPAHFSMPSNSALIPAHHTRASFPSNCDMDKSTSLSGNAGTYSSGGADFLQYPLGSAENFMGDQYMGTFGKAPLLFSHTMHRSSNYPDQEYEITTNASPHTMDGSSSVSAQRQYEATRIYRAPLFASHTLDGSSSYQTVCQYATSPARIASVEYNTVGRRQSDAQLANEESSVLYGTSQTVQMFVPATGHYG